MPLVRNAGAVFVGADASAVIGDYVAGRRTTCCPPAAPRGSPTRCASPTSASTCTSCRSSRAHCAASRRSSRRSPRPKGSPRTPTPIRRAGAVVSARPRPCSRATTSARSTGYHSPQVDVAVRLNTNESPYAPPAEFVDALTRPRSRDVAWHRYPDRGAHELRARARRVPRPAARSGCSARTAATRCCRRCCSPTAAPGRRALMFEPTYALHAQIARGTGHRGRRRRARRRLRDRRRRRRRELDASDAAVGRVRVQPEQPDRHGRAARDGRAAARRRGARSARCSSSTRPTASSRRGARSSSSTTTRPLVVVRTYSKVWSLAGGAPRLRGRARVGDRRAREGAAAVHALGARRRSRARSRSTSAREMEQRVASLVEERGRLFAALAASCPASTVCPSGANFLLVPRRRRRARPVEAAARRTACWCATSRRGRASKGACASRSARPPRTMHSSPRSTRSCRRS